jgi:hypothetical protein
MAGAKEGGGALAPVAAAPSARLTFVKVRAADAVRMERSVGDFRVLMVNWCVARKVIQGE